MPRRNTKPSLSDNSGPAHRAVLAPAAAAAPAFVPDPVIMVQAVEPHWHDGIHRDKGARYQVKLSAARQLGRLVTRC